ncbi:IS4 family transposase [bacterium]|nr:IS4 family transposase [bacterium]
MAHYNTILHQLLQLVPRHVFDRTVAEEDADKYVKAFTCWNQFTVLLWAQIAGRDTLRDIETGLFGQSAKLYHLGLPVVKRSTLADANRDRPYAIAEKVFYSLLERCQALSPKHPFRFKNKLHSIDATTIELCLQAFPWARYATRKGAVKLHTMITHDGDLPEVVVVTPGNVHDLTPAKQGRFPILPDSIYVFDRGYLEFAWLWAINEAEAYFVTRLKEGLDYEVAGQHKPAAGKGVKADLLIRMWGDASSGKYPQELRAVVYHDEEHDVHYKFITNNFTLAASTIAQIYKARWKIELFFKWIKQNLKIKSFLGTTLNAVMTQVWVAMCYVLLLAYITYKTKCGYTWLELSRMLQTTLLERMSLIDLLRLHPSQPPPRAAPGDPQLTFSFA